jgi:D-alanyl-D-alanine dipeptidase
LSGNQPGWPGRDRRDNAADLVFFHQILVDLDAALGSRQACSGKRLFAAQFGQHMAKAIPPLHWRADVHHMRSGAMIRALVVGLTLSFGAAHAAELPPGFVRLADVAPSIRQEMRYATSDNFVGRPIDGYRAADCWLLENVAVALAKVAEDAAAAGWRLVTYDCYRPTRAVADFVAWSKDPADQKQKAEYYPGIDKAILFKAGYIATRSDHSRGTTVDIGAETAEGGRLDFGTPFDTFADASATASQAVPKAAQRNRAALVELMAAHGFVNYRKEWWHFSFDMPKPGGYDFPIE